MALALLLAVAGCEELEYEGWLGKPIPITLEQGIPTIPVISGGRGPVTAVIDTGSPLTVFDRGGSGSGGETEFRLQHGILPSKSRFIFPELEVYDLGLGKIGLDKPISVEGIVGASLLSSFTVRIDYGLQSTLTLSDDLPDEDHELAGECKAANLTDPLKADKERCTAVIGAPRIGGGKLMLDDDLLDLPPTRLVIDLCLAPADFDLLRGSSEDPRKPSGVQVTAIVATGLGTSVITSSAYKRLAAADATLKAEGGRTLYLTGGTEKVSLVKVPRVAVVSNQTPELGPCGELALRRRWLLADKVPLGSELELMIEDKRINGASAALSTTPTTFAVMRDDAPLIQSLRNEVQPYASDVDVVLGGSFLELFDVIIDYPANRMILRCSRDAPTGSCQVLPWCARLQEDSPACPDLDK
jgi:hypothetical protein